MWLDHHRFGQSIQLSMTMKNKKRNKTKNKYWLFYIELLYFQAQIVHFVCLGCKATAKYFCWNKGRLWRFVFKRMISCRVLILSSFLGLRLSLGPAMAADQLVACTGRSSIICFWACLSHDLPGIASSECHGNWWSFPW